MFVFLFGTIFSGGGRPQYHGRLGRRGSDRRLPAGSAGPSRPPSAPEADRCGRPRSELAAMQHGRSRRDHRRARRALGDVIGAARAAVQPRRSLRIDLGVYTDPSQADHVHGHPADRGPDRRRRRTMALSGRPPVLAVEPQTLQTERPQRRPPTSCPASWPWRSCSWASSRHPAGGRSARSGSSSASRRRRCKRWTLVGSNVLVRLIVGARAGGPHPGHRDRWPVRRPDHRRACWPSPASSSSAP